MSNEQDYTVDNRDPSTTWLTLSDGSYIEVDPFDLLRNSLENLGEDGMMFVNVLNWLENRVNEHFDCTTPENIRETWITEESREEVIGSLDTWPGRVIWVDLLGMTIKEHNK